jgi:alpha-tubulin suppressor-like RCC1 family protein
MTATPRELILNYLETRDYRLLENLSFDQILHAILYSDILYLEITRDNELWKNLYYQHFNIPPETEDNYFYNYQEQYRHRIWVTGKNTKNKLLPSDEMKISLPTEINIPIGIIHVATGKDHTIMLDFQGKVYGMGDNSKGQLGFDDLTERSFPEEITFPGFESDRKKKFDEKMKIKAVKIACGDNFTYIMTVTDTLQELIYNMGDNSSGQLGHGDFEDRHFPSIIYDKIKIQEIICGKNHVYFHDYRNLWGCGDNSYGQLAYGKGTPNYFYQKIYNVPKIYDSEGEEVTYSSPSKINILTLLFDDLYHVGNCVATGANHVILKDKNDHLWGMGDNSRGQLGLGTELKNTLTSGPQLMKYDDLILNQFNVYCGANFSILEIDGALYGFGDNSNNQLTALSKERGSSNIYELQKINTVGEDGTDLYVTGIFCGWDHLVLEANDKKYYATGDRQSGKYLDRLYLPENSTIDNVVCGNMCTFFITHGYILIRYEDYLLMLQAGIILSDEIKKIYLDKPEVGVATTADHSFMFIIPS